MCIIDIVRRDLHKVGLFAVGLDNGQTIQSLGDQRDQVSWGHKIRVGDEVDGLMFG